MMSQDKDAKVVLTYLQHISKSIDIISQTDHESSMSTSTFEEPQSRSPEYYIDKISRSLLQTVCDPQALSQPVPTSLLLKEYYDDGTEKPTRIKSRIDALRNIYRTMAPIALDVAARVSALIVSMGSELSGNDNVDVDGDAGACGEFGRICTNSFCLYAIWLPIAPQIAQIVMDLFQWDSFISPLEFLKERETMNTASDENRMDVDIEEMDCDTKHATNGDKAVAVFSETACLLIRFFAERGDHTCMKNWWEWTQLFGLLGDDNAKSDDVTAGMDVEMKEQDLAMEDDDDEETEEFVLGGWAERPYNYTTATRWFAARAVANLLNLTPVSRRVYIERMGLGDEMVPWVLHPWIIMDEEVKTQNNQLRGVICLIQDGEEIEVDAPVPAQVRQNLSLPSSMSHLGNGLVIPRKNTVVTIDASEQMRGDEATSTRQGLVMTETTSKNLSLLGRALCSDPYPPPILVCGPRGAGKSSLIRELAHYCTSGGNDLTTNDLLELHVDEETDSKTLLGSYAATDIPGEFTWRPGALTNAVRKGKWVLLEDAESCPAEIQAALVKLFEERVLPLGVGKSEKCHPKFRMFGTCTTATSGVSSQNGKRRLQKGVTSAGSGGKRLLHPGLWRKVHVDPLPYSELLTVSRDLFPSLPQAVSDAALNVLRRIDKSGRSEDLSQDDNDGSTENDTEEKKEGSGAFQRRIPLLGNGRHSSVRDLVKLLSRISTTVHFEPGATFCTESQRILCMAESFDIFAGWCPCRHLRKDFVTMILAPIWGIPATAAIRYIEDRQPQVQTTDDYIEVGRATIRRPLSTLGNMTTNENNNFAETNYSLRLMEAAGVCISQNEPTLLVGGE